MTVIIKPKTVKVGNSSFRASLFHPRICSHFTAHLLVDTTGVFGFGEFMRHGATHDEFPGARASRLYLDGYTYVEATPKPLPRVSHNTEISVAKTHVVFNKGLNGDSLFPKLLVECLGSANISSFVNDVFVRVKSRSIRNRAPAQ